MPARSRALHIIGQCRSCRAFAYRSSADVQLPRRFHVSNSQPSQKTSEPDSAGESETFKANWDQYKTYFHFPNETRKSSYVEGEKVTLRGFLGKPRNTSSKLAFADLSSGNGPSVQVISQWETEGSPEFAAHQGLKAIPVNSAVSVTGVVKSVAPRPPSSSSLSSTPSRWWPSKERDFEISLQSIQCLSPFPSSIVVSRHANFGPEARHLDMRFNDALRQRLFFRAWLADWARSHLRDRGFLEVETPVLFKATPEGAREFIVPTRRKGFAYALPQSPQQYKQVLMAAGVRSYYQMARCFRDEDLRADRQPEFTQLDLEMAFATGADVMELVEGMIKALWKQLQSDFVIEESGATGRLPVFQGATSKTGLERYPDIDETFPRITYDEAMTRYGSDKPDLRIPNEIHRIDALIPPTFTSMITSLPSPIVEACKFTFSAPPSAIRAFIASFMESQPSSLTQPPSGIAAPLVVDSSLPLSGLSSLGHQGYEALTNSASDAPAPFPNLSDGDVLLVQARPDAPFAGAGGTPLGALRREMYLAAVAEGLMERDDGFRFAWVVGFPLFTARDGADGDPGQGGSAGFASTHHPFTAPLTSADFALLAVDPLAARADHYDLVVNGAELGGGSRRIHVAAVQEYVLRDVLGMDDAGVARFAHLLRALGAGCPPHAGIALGFDRLVAMLSFTGSVRDVIAFPKNMKGEDMMVKSPGRLERRELETYHLEVKKR